jgi:hypothetical protein
VVFKLHSKPRRKNLRFVKFTLGYYGDNSLRTSLLEGNSVNRHNTFTTQVANMAGQKLSN